MTTKPMAVPNATARSSACSCPMRKRPRAGACTRTGEDAPQQTTKQEPNENRAHRRARLLAHDVVLLLFRLQDHEQTGSMTISRTAMWIGEKIVGVRFATAGAIACCPVRPQVTFRQYSSKVAGTAPEIFSACLPSTMSIDVAASIRRSSSAMKCRRSSPGSIGGRNSTRTVPDRFRKERRRQNRPVSVVRTFGASRGVD